MNSTAEPDDMSCMESYEPEYIKNIEVLRHLSIFKDISFEIIKLFAYTAKRGCFPKGRFIFRQGEKAHSAHLILSGKVRLFAKSGDQKIELQHFGEKDFFGYMALLADFKWGFDVQAVSDVDILFLEREHFRKIFNRFPEECLLIVEKLVQMRMNRIEEHMVILIEKFGENAHLNLEANIF